MLDPGPALAQDLLDLGLFIHPAGTKVDTGAGRLKKSPKDGARPEGNPPPPPSTSPAGKDASLKAREEGKQNKTLP